MALTLVLDLAASLYMGLVDASGRTLSRRVRENARGETAHGLLDEILAEAGIGPGGISAVAVGVGPGSFTGIRVGVALAQGLAFAGRLPLHPFSSLAAMRACVPAGTAGASEAMQAGKAPVQAASSVVAAIAANAGRYYVSAGMPAAETLMGAEDLLALGGSAQSPSRPILITYGPVPAADVTRLAGAFADVLRLEDRVDLGAIASLALEGQPVRDGIIRPNYLMASAAEEKRQAAGNPAAAAGLPAAADLGGAGKA